VLNYYGLKAASNSRKSDFIRDICRNILVQIKNGGVLLHDKCVLFQRDRRTKSAGSGLAVVDKASFRRNFTADELSKYQAVYVNGGNSQVRSMPGTK
jgi:hypothetical protein